MLTKAERQEARVMLAQTHVGSRYKRELLHQALDSLDEIEGVLSDAVNEGLAQHAHGCNGMFYKDSAGLEPWPCKCGYKEWLERARKVLEE